MLKSFYFLTGFLSNLVVMNCLENAGLAVRIWDSKMIACILRSNHEPIQFGKI